MKTRKEQIDEMANIIKADYKQWLDITGVFPEGSSYYFECLGGGEDCAELLYKAGYGDVSEYKAEIERLKADYAKIQEQFAQYQMASDKEIKAQIKQAQIDILNKANERLNVVSREFGDDCDLCGVSAVCSCRCEINNLIKEIENE